MKLVTTRCETLIKIQYIQYKFRKGKSFKLKQSIKTKFIKS